MPKTNYDVCVVGGGTAGSMFAIAAAKLDLNVLLVEKSGCLGGTSTNGLVSPSMPTYVKKTKLYSEFEAVLKKYDGEIYPPNMSMELASATIDRPDEASTVMYFSSEAMQFALEDMCLSNNVTILYDCMACHADVHSGTIASIDIIGPNGRFTISADNFIDATGDAVLSKLAGANINYGNSEDNNNNQYTSLRFEIGNIDMNRFLHYMNVEMKQTYTKAEYPFYTFGVLHQGKEQVLDPLMKQAIVDGVITEYEYKWLQGFSIPSKDGVFTFNCPRIPNKTNIIDPFVRSQNYAVGRKMILKFVEFMNKYVPGFEAAHLTKIAPMIGIRESARVVGKYQITAEDYFKRRKFADGVVQADWWIDIHKDDHSEEDEKRFDFQEYFEIPYRALVTNELSNLGVIGRCISADFQAQASIRIQPQCRLMGEAMAIGCKLAKVEGVALNQVNGEKIKEEMSKRYE